MLVVTRWGGKLVVPSEDLSLTPELVAAGLIEVPLTRYLINTVRRGWTVFDVGANIGYFTILLGMLVGREGKVVSFEANPGVLRFLRDNVSMNYLAERVSVHEKAVYSRRKSLKFYVVARFMGDSSIQKHGREWFEQRADEVTELEVEAEPLDMYLRDVERVNLIKMDIEGGEYQALLGMHSALVQGKIDTVVFELNKMMLQSDWGELLRLLQALEASSRYSFFALSEDGEPVPLSLEQLAALESYPFVVMRRR